MTYKTFITRDFTKCLRDLQQTGRRDLIRKARAAMSEASTEGEIRDLSRTHHGEDRLPNVEKYDLGGGYRLVVQLVDGQTKARAFLFAGDHDDAQAWLDNHRNYRWVKGSRDSTLQFVQLTPPDEPTASVASRLNLSAPESTISLPLLSAFAAQDWAASKLSDEMQRYAATITGEDFERDADGILEYVAEKAGYETASFILDLLHHAHAGEIDQLFQRVRVEAGDAAETHPLEIVAAMSDPRNSDVVITFEEDSLIDEAIQRGTFVDWMLFLHPEQQRVSYKDFSGPVRVRGVSGSGKTSVLVHRARYLARQYGMPIAVLSLTESMRKLLEALVRDLCGAEQALIDVLTVSQLEKQVIEFVHPQGLRWFLPASPQQLGVALSQIVRALMASPDWKGSPFRDWDRGTFADFLREEIGYVRGRLEPDRYEDYMDAKRFQRKGRSVALSEPGRKVTLAGIRMWHSELTRMSLLDNEGIAASALRLVRDSSHSFRRYRAILADEVQDLSQIDVMVLALLRDMKGSLVSEVENGLFLAGDGAQSIFKRGFSLRSAGIDVSGRSFLLKKNYRNTHEILTAAYALIENYEFADSDEQDFGSPARPDFATRRGDRPKLIKCAHPESETSHISFRVNELLESGMPPGQICVIGPNVNRRREAQIALQKLGIPSVELRDDVGPEGTRVKISTIESAKGHEFRAVLIFGLVEGCLPHTNADDTELSREASRLYVAMTRARDELWLYYNTQSRPSRFLIPIQQYCDEFTVANGRLESLTQLPNA